MPYTRGPYTLCIPTPLPSGLENVDYDAAGDAYKGRSTAPKKRKE